MADISEIDYKTEKEYFKCLSILPHQKQIHPIFGALKIEKRKKKALNLLTLALSN